MNKLGIILDSTALKTEALVNHPDVYYVPLQVIVEDTEVYEDGVNLETNDLVKLLKQDKEMTTSQPALGTTVETYMKVKEKEYDHVFVLSISSNLSGTYNTLRLAQEQVEVPNLEVIDTYSIGGCMSVMAEEMLKMNEAGSTIEEMRERLQLMIDTATSYVYPSSLKRLMLSGRLNKAVGTVASFMKLRILLGFENKQKTIDKYGVYRTENKLAEELVKITEKWIGPDEDGSWAVYLLNLEADKLEKKFEEAILERYPNLEIRHSYIPSIIATHVGLETVALQLVKIK